MSASSAAASGDRPPPRYPSLFHTPDGSATVPVEDSATDTNTTAAAAAAADKPVYTIILYYLYTRVADPVAILAWQQAVCERLGLLGRIRVATEGINGTLAGTREAIDAYIADMNDTQSEVHHGVFAGITYKFSRDTLLPFPALGLFHVPELTASGSMAKSCKKLLEPPTQTEAATGEAQASSSSSAAAAEVDTHLTPAEFHAALASFNPETDLLLDTRNAYETSIGLFEGAVDPKLRSFAQLPEWTTQNLAALKTKKKLLMYCTGGIRCEKASLYMAHRTGIPVFQLKGGIHTYLEQYKNGGFFKGKNFVFDGRLAMASEDKTIVGRCTHCAVPCDDLSEKVLCRVCHSFVILCPTCVELYDQKGWRIYCAEHILLAAGKDYEPPAAAAQVAAANEEAAVSSASATPAPGPAVAGSAAAAAGSDQPDADAEHATDESAAAARPEDHWSPPKDDPGCPDQLEAFLARFTTEQLQGQIGEIQRILEYFRVERKHAGGRSRNRKANLHLEKRRLEDYLYGRRCAEATARGEPLPENPRLLQEASKKASRKEPRGPPQPKAAATEGAASAAGETEEKKAPPPALMSFVPLLNV